MLTLKKEDLLTGYDQEGSKHRLEVVTTGFVDDEEYLIADYDNQQFYVFVYKEGNFVRVDDPELEDIVIAELYAFADPPDIRYAILGYEEE